jgi:hypothetical protein
LLGKYATGDASVMKSVILDRFLSNFNEFSLPATVTERLVKSAKDVLDIKKDEESIKSTVQARTFGANAEKRAQTQHQLDVKSKSQNIDFAKGIDVMPIPKFWGDWSKIKDEDTPDVAEQKKQNNRLVCNQRPYFFRYVYEHQNNAYLKHIEKYQEYADNNNSTLNNLGDNKVQHYFERYSPKSILAAKPSLINISTPFFSDWVILSIFF